MEIKNKTNKEYRRKKWLKLSKRRSSMRFNQRKFVKRFVRYSKESSPTNSTDEFDYYAASGTQSNAFDYRRKKHEMKEMNMKKQVQKQAFESKQNFGFIDEPEVKRIFLRRKAQENVNPNAMWTLLDRTQREKSHDNLMSEYKEPAWKISKMSLPTNRSGADKTGQFKVTNPNLLWRSLEHIQRLYEDGHLQEESEVISVKFDSGCGPETVCDYFLGQGQIEVGPGNLRKARLSRWNFLRYDQHDGNDQKSPKVISHPMFFVRKKNPKSDCIKNSTREDAKPRGGHLDEWSSNTEESCNCSCCSCDTCTTEDSMQAAQRFTSNEEMAPTSEEDFHCKPGWRADFAVGEKEPLRPPVYNPEDYAISLKKWGRKTNSGMQLPLYLSQSTGSIEKLSRDGSLQEKGQYAPSTKSSSSIKSGDEKHSKKEKDLTLKIEKKDLKNKENLHRGMKNDLNVDFRNPILALSNQEGEMSLRQFSSVTELLGKLKVDLKLSFPSFVQEFVGDPVDGVTLLLELLRAVQLSQASQQQKRPPQIFRRALLDEHSCLICLKHCLRCSDTTRRLVSSPAGLFTLAVCIMSNVTQSRIIALELLTKACEIQGSGHRAVSEALSTLRLRFGEPVRFRFLVGMLNSAGTIELLATAMKFINVFIDSASNIQQKVYIQAELEQAGFDAKTLRKSLPCNSESVKIELNRWEKSYLDVESLQSNMVEVNSLHEKILLLEKRIEILQEEKGILQSLEQCLKERCSELEEEVSIKTNTTSKTATAKQFQSYKSQQTKRNIEKEESTPAEDEGISSSEQEMSQDEDFSKNEFQFHNSKEFEQATNSNDSHRTMNRVKNSGKSSNRLHECNGTGNCSAKNYKNTRNNKMTETNVDDGNEIIRNEGEINEEEETTIDEVIEELENIVNNAETQVYVNEENKSLKFQSFAPINRRQTTATIDANRMYDISIEREAYEESEIVPSHLHPHPPRKAKSLVHIYFPCRRDFDSHEHVKNEFFDEDTDTESSDSLLTATREKRSMSKSCHRSLDITDSFGSFSSTNTRTLFIKHDDEYVENDLNVKGVYEERNIDDEEIKRRHNNNNNKLYKGEKVRTENFTSPIFFKDNKFGGDFKKPVFHKDFISERIMLRGSVDRLNEKPFGNTYEKTTSFQGVRTCREDQMANENEFLRGMPKYPPTPVKRSQTFHLTTSNCDVLYKRNEIKPKPKMGVSGLDFLRNTEQKLKNDKGKYQNVEHMKSFEKPDASERYSRGMSKEAQKHTKDGEDWKRDSHLYRRGSFDGVISPDEREAPRSQRVEKLLHNPISGFRHEMPIEKPCAKIRSKSLEKMDEGLDSLVDIVIATDESKKFKPKTEGDLNGEGGKNIGPRTRRSLAESSLFNPPRDRLLMKSEDPSKPPKPAQRTSLTRHNSSSSPPHLPKDIQLAPVQPNPRQQVVYNFGMKSAKSEDSLFSGVKRCPPDGSSNPMELKNRAENQNSTSDVSSPIYSSAVKQPKHQTVFGSTKFENGQDTNSNQTFFGAQTGDFTVSPMPRSVQNISGNGGQKVKSFSSDQKPIPPKSTPSKPNFLLGTYQSQSSKNIPKPSSSVLNSINNFNNSFLGKKSNGNCKMYANHRLNGSGHSSPTQNLRNPETANSGNRKLTDSPSGLY